jgi:hypothetical protein
MNTTLDLISPQCYSPLGVIRELLLIPHQDSSCSLLLQSPLTELSETSLQHYLTILLLTIALELSFFLLPFYLSHFPVKKTLLHGSLAALLCNLISHPFVYFIFPLLGMKSHLSYLSVLISAELFAPTLEILILISIWRLPRRSVIPSLITANLTSWWIGIYLT